MTYDRSTIMKNAWRWAREEERWKRAYDWTPGPTYGRVRAPTAAERRAVLADCLRRAWASAKGAVAYRRSMLEMHARPVAVVEREIFALEGKNRWTPADYRLRQQLTTELRAAHLQAA